MENNIVSTKKQIEDIAEKLVKDKCAETENGLNILWNYELAQEIAANAQNETAVQAIEPYVQPKCTVNQNGNSASIGVDFAPDKPLHPGLDTLAKMAIQNIMTKFKYNRQGGE